MCPPCRAKVAQTPGRARVKDPEFILTPWCFCRDGLNHRYTNNIGDNVEELKPKFYHCTDECYMLISYHSTYVGGIGIRHAVLR